MLQKTWKNNIILRPKFTEFWCIYFHILSVFLALRTENGLLVPENIIIATKHIILVNKRLFCIFSLCFFLNIILCSDENSIVYKYYNESTDTIRKSSEILWRSIPLTLMHSCVNACNLLAFIGNLTQVAFHFLYLFLIIIFWRCLQICSV